LSYLLIISRIVLRYLFSISTESLFSPKQFCSFVDRNFRLILLLYVVLFAQSEAIRDHTVGELDRKSQRLSLRPYCIIQAKSWIHVGFFGLLAVYYL